MLMGPGTLGLAATQINVFVNTVLATGAGHRRGVVAELRVPADVPADRPLRRVDRDRGAAGRSRAMPRGDDMPGDAARRSRAAIAMMLMLNVPATRRAHRAGPSDRRACCSSAARSRRTTPAATAAALQFYAIGLLGYSVVKIVSPTFYALHESRKPVIVSAASVLVNAALNIAFVKRFGYLGLAVGTSLTALLNAVGAARDAAPSARRHRGRAACSASAPAAWRRRSPWRAAAYAIDSSMTHLLPGRALSSRRSASASSIAGALVVMLARVVAARPARDQRRDARAAGRVSTRPRRGLTPCCAAPRPWSASIGPSC